MRPASPPAVLLLPAAGPAMAGAGRVVAYDPSRVGEEFPPAATDLEPFTGLRHAFLTVSPDGSHPPIAAAAAARRGR